MPSEKEGIRRLHPSSLLFTLGSAARNLLIPGVVLLLLGRGEGYEIWFMVLFGPAAIFSVVRYLTYRYCLGEDELIVQQGIVTRNERHIPYTRIQNIDLIQNPLHRLFRVATVRIETASGTETEANLQVLSLPAVEEMRRRIFAGRAAAPDDAPGEAEEAPTPAFHLPVSELVLLGMISPRGLAIVGAALGFLYQLDFFEDFEDRVMAWMARIMDLTDLTSSQQTWFAFATVLALLVLTQVLSVAWSVVRLYDFTLTRVGHDLRARCGLFTQVSGTIPQHRIQVLSIRETLFMRACGRVAVKAHTAGGHGNQQSSGVSRQWIAPLIRRDRLGALLAEVQPEIRLDELDWQPVHPRTARRLVRKVLLVIALVTGIATAIFGPWALLAPVALVPLGVLAVYLDLRVRAFAESPQVFVYRSGWWVRRLTAVRYDKIQTVSLEQSPFDRRWKMAGIQIDTAGGLPTERLYLPYLRPRIAQGLLGALSHRAAREEFRW